LPFFAGTVVIMTENEGEDASSKKSRQKTESKIQENTGKYDEMNG